LDYSTIPLPDVLFNHDHHLDVGPSSCMCNFGMEYAASIGRTGHVALARRVLAGRPRAEWPLVYWDEEEQEGRSFADAEGRFLSSWLAAFPRWQSDLAEHRAALVAFGEAHGDDAVGPVIDAIIGGETATGSLAARVAPGALLARTHARAEGAELTLGRLPRRPSTTDWSDLIAQSDLYNAPLAFQAASAFSVEQARSWLQRDLKYDIGGSIGLANITRRAARVLLAAEPDPDWPWWPVVAAFDGQKYIGGDPFCAAGRRLLQEQPAEAITAFGNAILFERGWSEEYHMEAFEGIGEAAAALGSDDFSRYLSALE